MTAFAARQSYRLSAANRKARGGETSRVDDTSPALGTDDHPRSADFSLCRSAAELAGPAALPVARRGLLA